MRIVFALKAGCMRLDVREMGLNRGNCDTGNRQKTEQGDQKMKMLLLLPLELSDLFPACCGWCGWCRLRIGRTRGGAARCRLLLQQLQEMRAPQGAGWWRGKKMKWQVKMGVFSEYFSPF